MGEKEEWRTTARLSHWESCDMAGAAEKYNESGIGYKVENTLTFLLMPDLLPIHPTYSQQFNVLSSRNVKRTPLRAEPRPSTSPSSLFLETSPSFPNRNLPYCQSDHSLPLPFPGMVSSISPTLPSLSLNFSHASNPGTSLQSSWPGQKVTLKTSETQSKLCNNLRSIFPFWATPLLGSPLVPISYQFLVLPQDPALPLSW